MQVYKLPLNILLIVTIFGCQPSTVETKIIKPVEPISTKKETSFQRHIVKKGETLFTISKSYNASMVDIMLDNGLSKDQELMTGRILKIRSSVGGNNYQDAALLKNSLTPPADKPKESNVVVPDNSTKGKHFSGNIPYMLIPKGEGYQKSIKGIVSKSFQDNHFGRPLQGLEIKSSSKQNVKAIHNGVVAFIAESFAGYGRCIAVASSRNEIFFIYGLDSITVKNGDVVNKGDSIGSIGSGKVLGLKILRNGIFQDPGRLIPGVQ